MFGMLTNLTKAALNVVVTPVDIIADVVTMGGQLTDNQESYTVKRLREAAKNLDNALEAKE